MKPLVDLTGTTALVTGASSGIGAATARLFAELGARVAMGYFRNEQGATATAESIRARGGAAIAIKADVRRASEVRRLVQRVTDELGPIDILVNNAGSLVERLGIRDISEERLDEIVALNLKS